MTTQQLNLWPINSAELIATGSYAHVYALSPLHVAKIQREKLIYGAEFCDIDAIDLGNECSIHSQLYEIGIQVPKPEGIFNIQLEGKVIAGFVSQRIYGISDYRTVPAQFKNIVEEQFRRQLEVAIKEGFHPNWDAEKNTIFEEHGQKLYLIDFHLWERI
ncbi:hypothetical protein HY484_02855 [Candidatus Woesearchaeota archaeon]|nr:hypothetical protein [Candidatus Woesearchaeota archaeon]